MKTKTSDFAEVFLFAGVRVYNARAMENLADEIELCARFKEGDAQAFDELVRRYAHRVYGFAYRHSGDHALAEDAIQDAFIKAWQTREKFKEGKAWRPWIFALTRNATIDILRRKKPLLFSRMEDGEELALGIADDSPLSDAEFDREIERKELEEALEKLTVDQRSVVILHDSENMTFEEIAALMGKPMNTVKSHYRRAIIKLRDIVKNPSQSDAPKNPLRP